MVCEILLTDTSRKFLAITMLIFMLTLAFMGGAFTVFGIYVGHKMGNFHIFLQGYAIHSLWWMLMFCGVFMIFFFIVSSGVVQACMKPHKRARCHMFLPVIMILLSLFILCELSVSIMCLNEKRKIRAAFSDGISKAMGNYRVGNKSKLYLDMLQMKYRCCGVNDYTDWFKLEWINLKYSAAAVQTANVGNRYLTDSVPFSCCDIKAARSCVHEAVNTLQFGYDPNTDLTLNEIGCAEALTESRRFSGLEPIGHMGVFAFFLMLLLLLLMRFFQTTISEALDTGDPSMETYGYLCQCEDPAEYDKGSGSAGGGGGGNGYNC